MKILEVYIDGYKNIINTRLTFKDSIVVLLSQNNFGKSNLISAISFGFEFIGLNQKEALREIESREFEHFFSDSKINFTFEVTFETKNKRVYKYKFALGNIPETNQYGICAEELSEMQDNHEKQKIFIRDRVATNAVRLYSRLEEFKRFQFEDKSQAARARLFLHPFGEASVEDAQVGPRYGEEFSEAYEKVREAYLNLLIDRTGEIVVNEHTDFADYSDFAKELKTAMHGNEPLFRDFENFFIELFPDYASILPHEDGAGNPYLLFEKKNGKMETTFTLSYGTRRMLRIFEKVFSCESPLVPIEELENGVHPSLFVKMLNILDKLLNREESGPVRLVITSHSSNLVNLFSSLPDALHLGLDGYMRANEAEARFVKFTDKGKQSMNEEIEKLGLTTSIGSIIYDYGEDEDCSTELRKWLEE